ncbi:hypothetical protein EV643_1206 [Kribbella sp. VKM Ac-2527]|uniref:Uncharacterized protein n=1 Tax=Kribbella caucasensis TaxID=2512215 RepID=A0A4R6JNG0_9ACTN|nr:hypothetical protein [Kribbella sp. VKM Ac-2527]TDO36276.1 hypothetical protein EV643_1206 [Kribbella sp. VKM Ac-2527]
MSDLPSVGRAVFDESFGGRVRALLRIRPVADAADNAGRQSWGDQRYDVVTLALAAIDSVIARQGFDDEVSYDEVVAGLEALAATAHPERPVDEHALVARYVIDALLNRREREAPYRYQISIFSRDGDGAIRHRQMPAEFRLLTEHEDHARGVNVLRASADAINALVGGLEFDVEDEQAAIELMLARQLERGAFGQAEKAAERSRLLSVRYADELRTLLADTTRDIRTVLDQWTEQVPQQLERNRAHLEERLSAEAKALEHVRGALDAPDAEPEVAGAAARIAGLLEECRHRHTELHGRLVSARTTFLDEQTRQSFRPVGSLRNPNITDDVFLPLLTLPADLAVEPAETFATSIAGTQVPRIVRFADLVDDLLAPRRGSVIEDPPDPDDELDDPDPPAVSAEVLAAAAEVVDSVELPSRLSALLSAARGADLPAEVDRAAVERVIALSVLWSFAPESVEDFSTAVDTAAQVLGPTAVVDADGTRIPLSGWSGDDLIVAEDEDALGAWAGAPSDQEAS